MVQSGMERGKIAMEEEKTLTEKPKKLWDGALKMVKGENTHQLIEQFTAEMTLVAEGSNPMPPKERL